LEDLYKIGSQADYLWITIVLIVAYDHIKTFKEITREIGLVQIRFERGQIFSEPTVP